MVVVLYNEPDIERGVVVNGLPTGSDFDNSIFTVNGISISGPLFNNTLQINVTSDPGWMGLGIILESATEAGTGTGDKV